MRKFLKDLLLFSALLLLYLLANLCINLLIIQRTPPRINASLLIMGDSHPMCALDPGRLHGARNVSQPAEPYFVTYYKLKELLKYNHIETILLGFSYQNISAFNDRKFSDTYWSDELFGRTYSIIPARAFKEIPIDRMSYAKALLRNLLLFPKMDHHPYIGEFSKQKNKLNVKRSPETAIQRHFFVGNLNAGISSLMIHYLDSIVRLSTQNHIRLLLISTPLHPDYQKLIPSNFVAGYNDQTARLQVKGISIADFSNFPAPDSTFADYDHLNAIGAESFTDTIRNRLLTTP